MKEVLIDALLDSVKLLPFLIIIYIIIEVIESKGSVEKNKKILSGKCALIIGSAIGLIPQCGFSVMTAKLYEKKFIRAGTLIAVFLSTSDEAFAILLSSGKTALTLLPLMAIKIVVAIMAGYFVNFYMDKKYGKGAELANIVINAGDKKAKDDCDDNHNHNDKCKNKTEKNCAMIKNSTASCCENGIKEADSTNNTVNCNHCDDDDDDDHCCQTCGKKHACKFEKYFLSPFLHSLQIFAFLLAVNIIFGIVIYYVGEDKISVFISRTGLIQPFLTALIGLIPNCASSVIITQGYILGAINFGSLVSGLLVNAGLGFIVILRNKKMWKRNLLIIAFSFLLSVLVGVIITLLI